MNSALLLPLSPFIDTGQQLADARRELLAARDFLHHARARGYWIKRATLRFYSALDGVWEAQRRQP